MPVPKSGGIAPQNARYTGRTRTVTVTGRATVNATWVDIGKIIERTYSGPDGTHKYKFKGGYGFVSRASVQLPAAIWGGQTFMAGIQREYVGYSTGSWIEYYGLSCGPYFHRMGELQRSKDFIILDDPYPYKEQSWSGELTSTLTLELAEVEYLDMVKGSWCSREIATNNPVTSLTMADKSWQVPLENLRVPANLQDDWSLCGFSAATSGKFFDGPGDINPPPDFFFTPDYERVWREWYRQLPDDYYAQGRTFGAAEATCKLSWSGPGTDNDNDSGTVTPAGYVGVNRAICDASGPRTSRAVSVSSKHKPVQRCDVTVRHLRFTEPEPTPTGVVFLRGYEDGSANGKWVRKTTDTAGHVSDSYSFGGDWVRYAGVKSVEGQPNATASGDLRGPTRTHDDVFETSADAPTLPLALLDRQRYADDVAYQTQTSYRKPTPYLGVTLRQVSELDMEGGAAGWPLDNPTTPPNEGWRFDAGIQGANAVTQLEVVNGALRFRITGETSPNKVWSVHRQYPVPQPPQVPARIPGYRWWRVRLRSVGAAQKSLKIDIVTLTTGADGEWVEREFDLLGDTIVYPNGDPGPNTRAQSESFKEMRFSDFDKDVTFEVAWIRGVRKHEAFTCVWDLSTYTGHIAGNQPRALSGWTDGLQSLNVGLGSPGFHPFTGITLKSFASVVQEVSNYSLWSGWTMTVPAASGNVGSIQQPDQFVGDDQWAWLLGGGGFTRAAGTDAPVSWYETSEGTAIPLVPRGHRPDFFDGCGDVQNGGGYGLTIPIHLDIVTGVRVRGVVVGGTGNVVAREVGGSGVSRGHVRPSGYYSVSGPSLVRIPDTNAPSGGHQPAYDLDTDDDFKYAIAFPPQVISQHPYRIGVFVGGQDALGCATILYVRWYTSSVSAWLSCDTSPSGLTMYADVSNAGKLRVSAAARWETDTWETWELGIEGLRPCLRFAPGAFTLWMVYQAGGGVARQQSVDGGRTWTMPVTVTNQGEFPALAMSPTGWQLVAWRDSAGAAQVKALDNQGQTLWTAVAVSVGVAEDALGLTWDGSAQRWYLLYREEGGAVRTKQSADGKVWI